MVAPGDDSRKAQGDSSSIILHFRKRTGPCLVLREAALQLLPRGVAESGRCADGAEQRLGGCHIHATHTAALLVRALKPGVAKAGHAAAAAAGHCTASL